MSSDTNAVAKSAPKVSLHIQADCARRELIMWQWVYPSQVAKGKMTEAEAAVEIDNMRAIRDTLTLFAEHETAIRDALRRAIEAERAVEASSSDPAIKALREAFPDAELVDIRDTCDEPPDIDAHLADQFMEPGSAPDVVEGNPGALAVEGPAP